VGRAYRRAGAAAALLRAGCRRRDEDPGLLFDDGGGDPDEMQSTRVEVVIARGGALAQADDRTEPRAGPILPRELCAVGALI